MKIVYKIRKECFYSPVIFWTRDILPSTLNLLPSTLDILPSTLHILPSALDLRPSTLACKNSGVEIHIDLQKG